VALGAAEGDIAGMVVRQAGTLAGIGIAIGIVAALGLTRLMESKLYEISPADPLSYAVSAVAFGVVAIAASLAPALRAARLNPVEALRAE
jgi:ABC-type antimicrobial peptide transport system permease subunit